MDGARRHGDRLAVAFVDLDHFKNVNDSLGHSVGDLLLKSVSRRLRACLRSQDVMARQGGDEFVVLLTRLHNRDDASVVATKMVEALRQPFLLQGHEVRVSASVGLDWFEEAKTAIETLLRHADITMYQAKSAGRNGWCFFSPEMGHTMSQRLMVEAGLRRAILNSELVLHYQPQVGCRHRAPPRRRRVHGVLRRRRHGHVAARRPLGLRAWRFARGVTPSRALGHRDDPRRRARGVWPVALRRPRVVGGRRGDRGRRRGRHPGSRSTARSPSAPATRSPQH